MKLYMLDSAPVAAFLQGRESAINLITPWILRREVATSILVYAEVTEYLKGLTDFTRRHKDLRLLLSEIYPYFLTYPILERYADLRRLLRSPYGPGLIGDIDSLIAATAIERNLTVVTADKDFERVPGLEVKLISIK